jgi:hypothetical protein
MKRILTAGDTVGTTRAAGGDDLAGAIVPAPARTIGQTLLAVVAISVAAQLAVPIPATPVPVSLQDLVVMLIGVLLGPAAGTSAVITYLAVGRRRHERSALACARPFQLPPRPRACCHAESSV